MTKRTVTPLARRALEDHKTLSAPTFSVRIDEALVSAFSIEDEFTLFAEALKAYEAGTTDPLALMANLETMRDSREFDGADGATPPTSPCRAQATTASTPTWCETAPPTTQSG